MLLASDLHHFLFQVRQINNRERALLPGVGPCACTQVNSPRGSLLRLPHSEHRLPQTTSNYHCQHLMNCWPRSIFLPAAQQNLFLRILLEAKGVSPRKWLSGKGGWHSQVPLKWDLYILSALPMKDMMKWGEKLTTLEGQRNTFFQITIVCSLWRKPQQGRKRWLQRTGEYL